MPVSTKAHHTQLPATPEVRTMSEHRARGAAGLEAPIALRALPQVVARIERPEALDALEPAARTAGEAGILGPVGPAAAAAVEPAPRPVRLPLVRARGRGSV